MNAPLDILYVEDDAADADFARSAMKDMCRPDITIHVIADGEAAAKFLGLDAGSAGATALPTLILLDLNIPRVHGSELLKMIKESVHLKKIPVVILSTSDHKRDIDHTRSLGAADYFSKPSSYQEYRNIFKTICIKWLSSPQ